MRAMYIAATGLAAQQLNVEVIANNLANVSTIGFKRGIANFQDLLYQTLKAPGSSNGTRTLPVGIQVGSGVRPESAHRIFTQGEFRRTDGEFDIAIEGRGFFQVALDDGSIVFTRSGAFELDKDGNIVTAEGNSIEPPISIPADTESVTISPTGIVEALPTGGGAAVQVGTLQLARFINPAGLISIGRNLYQESLGAGEKVVGAPGDPGFGRTLQKTVEWSNVNIAEEMINMIIAQRSYEVNSKAIQTGDDMLGVVNTLKR